MISYCQCSNPQWPSLDSEVTLPSAGGEGAADFNSRGDRSAESDDRRSVFECGGRGECNLYSVQQFAGCIMILIYLSQQPQKLL